MFFQAPAGKKASKAPAPQLADSEDDDEEEEDDDEEEGSDDDSDDGEEGTPLLI